MTDRPGDEAEPIEVEAFAEDRPAEEAARTPEETAAARRRRRGRLFLLLWLLSVVLILALGYLAVDRPERVAAFLHGKPPGMASAADMERLADRISKIEADSADTVQADARSAAIAANRDGIGKAAGEMAALRGALGEFEERVGARMEELEKRIASLEAAEPSGDPALAAQVAEHEERLAGLEARPVREDAAGTTAADPGLARLKGAVAALEGRLEGLEAIAGTDGLEARVEATDRAAAEAGADAERALAELAALRDAVGDLARAGAAGESAKLAVARLRFAVDSGAPFKEELEALRAAGGPAFGAWTARAEQGLPTADALARRFKELARARTLRPEGATGTPWLDDVVGRLSEVVSVRKVSKDLPGEGANAALGRAEAHVEEGDLAGAVAALGGDAPPPFADWLAVARERLAANAELEALTARDGR